MVSIEPAKADYTYCTACGVSWREKTLYDIVLDNMKFRVCVDCLKELDEKITSVIDDIQTTQKA